MIMHTKYLRGEYNRFNVADARWQAKKKSKKGTEKVEREAGKKILRRYTSRKYAYCAAIIVNEQ